MTLAGAGFGVRTAEDDVDARERQIVQDAVDQLASEGITVHGEMVNATLVREGYAMASTYPPDVRYSELFASLQREAREAARGLWGPACASPSP